MEPENMASRSIANVAADKRPTYTRIRISNRVNKLRDDFLSSTPYVCGERSHLFTEYWNHSEGEPIALRRAKAFEYVLHHKKITIHDGELIVGNQTKYRRGGTLYPEFCTDWIEEELEFLSSRETSKFEITTEDRNIILDDLNYWKGKTVKDVLLPLWREKWGNLIEDGVKTRLSFNFDTPAPHGRQVVNFPKVLNQGLLGIIEEAQEQLAHHLVLSHEDLHKKYFWEAVIIVCNAVIVLAQRYAALAKKKSLEERDSICKQELEVIAENCTQVPAHPAKTFHQALQSIWFTHLAVQIENNSWGYSPGRLDQYLYPFYKRDLDEGHITQDEARELLGSLWIKFAEIELLHQGATAKLCQGSVYQNVTIGGQTEEGEDATNELSYLILEVEKEIKLSQPTLSLRYFDGLQEEFLFKCTEVIRSGGGKPAIFCDTYALSTLSHYGIPLKEARTYTPTGCVEIGFGIESGSQKILDVVNKRTNVEENLRVVQRCKEVGITTNVFIMIGLPGETYQTVEETKRWMKKARPDKFGFNIFVPYPGTPISRHPEKYDIIIHEMPDKKSWAKGRQGGYEAFVSTSELSSQEILRLFNELFKYYTELTNWRPGIGKSDS